MLEEKQYSGVEMLIAQEKFTKFERRFIILQIDESNIIVK